MVVIICLGIYISIFHSSDFFFFLAIRFLDEYSSENPFFSFFFFYGFQFCLYPLPLFFFFWLIQVGSILKLQTFF